MDRSKVLCKIKDPMERSGMRWTEPMAEAIVNDAYNPPSAVVGSTFRYPQSKARTKRYHSAVVLP